MDISFTCPHCEQTLVVDRTGAGKTIPCPTCNREILIPLDSEREEVQDTSIAIQTQSFELDRIRNSARLMVEDHWRQFITLGQVDMKAGFKAIYSFEATIKEAASNMPEPDATIFRRTIQAERDKLANEYDRNPDALKARLGLPTSLNTFTPSGNRQGTGELVVRTAVRATIWESIWAIFRLFR